MNPLFVLFSVKQTKKKLTKNSALLHVCGSSTFGTRPLKCHIVILRHFLRARYVLRNIICSTSWHQIVESYLLYMPLTVLSCDRTAYFHSHIKLTPLDILSCVFTLWLASIAANISLSAT